MTAPPITAPEALRPIARGETAGVPHLARVVPAAADLFSQVRNAAAMDERETTTRLAADPFLLRAREVAQYERSRTVSFHETVAAIGAKLERGELGRVGAEESRLQAQHALDADIAKIDGAAQTHTDAFLANYGPSRLPTAGPDAAASVAIASTIFRDARAEAFLEHLAGWLSRAMDPNETASARTHANVVLNALQPLLDRRVARPEAHAVDSAPAAGDLHFLISEHLDTLLGRRRAARAQELVDTVSSEKAWVRGKMQALGGWDHHYAKISAPTLYGGQQG